MSREVPRASLVSTINSKCLACLDDGSMDSTHHRPKAGEFLGGGYVKQVHMMKNATGEE